MAKEKILVRPNPNDDGFSDCWVCEHIDCHPARFDGEVTLCGEVCADLLEGGGEIVKVSRAAITSYHQTARQLLKRKERELAKGQGR
jgi:hypothetical protein